MSTLYIHIVCSSISAYVLHLVKAMHIYATKTCCTSVTVLPLCPTQPPSTGGGHPHQGTRGVPIAVYVVPPGENPPEGHPSHGRSQGLSRCTAVPQIL